MLTTKANTPTLAKTLAPEELRVGEYVAVLNEVVEVGSFCWNADPSLLPPDQPVRIVIRSQEPGTPLRVRSICLPFVLVKRPCGQHRTLDVRGCQLVRLDRVYARAARDACRGPKKKGKRRRRRA
ncbi:hypothetical protein Pla123a_22410 [Posidoniimonas polymericola]|uniref:Uncharacterized protein n=1 Tax=Posidoniimonas polymericola TaxID=2528002 RepID=A0A5C5YPV5_9BACT|nr:hypothetical protein [Posidoniimonas polymericola]TWT76818.1 hypothetical protein Pla123a_22410 [Posidoniimonas polymericola]